MSEKFCYSTNQEEYQGEYTTREESIVAAIEENDDLEAGSHVWTGRLEHIEVLNLLDRGDRFIEGMTEQAFFLAGEAADGWLDHVAKDESDALMVRVAEAVTAWISEKPERAIYFQAVDSIETHTITDDLILEVR